MGHLQMLICVVRLFLWTFIHGIGSIAQVLLQLVLCLVVALSEDIEGASSIEVPLELCVLLQMDLQFLAASFPLDLEAEGSSRGEPMQTLTVRVRKQLFDDCASVFLFSASLVFRGLFITSSTRAIF